MARYACDADAQRYGGPQRSIYLSAYAGSGKRGWLLRLCKPHFTNVAVKVLQSTTSFDDPNPDEPLYCPVCMKLDADGYLVATLFDQNEEPQKVAGVICPEHVDGLLEALGVRGEPQVRD